MRTEQINYLKALKKYGSVTAAAEFLNISPPALSLSIKKLEEELDCFLMIRSSKGVELTEVGNRLLNSGEIFLKALEEIKSISTSNNQNSISIIDILCGQNAVDQFLPHVACEFHKQHEYLYVNPIVENISDGLQIMIEDSSKELLFCYNLWKDSLANLAPNFNIFSFQPLAVGRYYCVVSRNSHLSKRSFITYDEFLQYPLLVYKAKSFDNNTLETKFLSDKHKKKTIILNNEAVYKEALINNWGISQSVMLPFKNLHSNKDFAFIPITECSSVPELHYGYFTVKNRRLSKNVELFLNYLKIYFEKQCI